MPVYTVPRTAAGSNGEESQQATRLTTRDLSGASREIAMRLNRSN